MIGNKIILGTVQFGLNYGINNSTGKLTREDIFKILDLAYRNNIRILDTAEAYGDAIDIIGAYHHKTGNIFKVISKFHHNSKENNNLGKIKSVLEKLGIENFEGLLFHSYNDYKNFPALKSNLIAVKEEGLVKKIGVSCYTIEETKALIKDQTIDIIQLPFNLLDNHGIKGDLLAKAKKNDKEIHSRSAFLQGLFFMNPDNLPSKLKPLKSTLIDIQNKAKKYNRPLNEYALNYAYQKDYLDHVLIGVDNLNQLELNLKAIENPISSELIKETDNLIVSDNNLLNPTFWN